MNESTSCTVCSRDLWQDELDRLACRLCERRLDDRLRSLAGPLGLFARLCLRNETGAPSTEPRVSGSATASIAGSLNILNETAEGGLVSVLEDWVADWARCGIGVHGTGVRPQYRVDQAIANFRRNLTPACSRYPGIAAFAAEINSYCRRYQAIIDGGREPAKAPATCANCGKPFKFDLFDKGGADCRNCGQHHTRAMLLQPDQAETSAA